MTKLSGPMSNHHLGSIQHILDASSKAAESEESFHGSIIKVLASSYFSSSHKRFMRTVVACNVGWSR